MTATIDLRPDALSIFGETLTRLPATHPRRIGLLLAQLGLLLTVGGFCVSIVAMNIGLVTSLAGCLLAGAPLHRLPTFWPFVAMTAALAASTVSHGEWRELVKTAIIPIGLLTAQVALHHAIPGVRHLRRAVAFTLIACITASALLALAQYCIGRGRNRPFRVDPEGIAFSQSSGFFGLHLTQGGLLGLVFFLVPAVVMDGWRSRWAWLGATAAGIAVLISGARSAVLGFSAGLVAMIAARGRRHLLLGVVAGSLLVGVGLLVLFATQRERFDRLIQLKDGRWPIWRASIAVIAEHPLIGTGGTTSFRAAYRDIYPSVVPDIPTEFSDGAAHAHNTQLSHAAEHGLPFAFTWLVLIGSVWLHLWRNRHENPGAFQCGTGLIVTALCFGQFEKLDGECSRTMWTALGILLAYCSSPRRDPTHQAVRPAVNTD